MNQVVEEKNQTNDDGGLGEIVEQEKHRHRNLLIVLVGIVALFLGLSVFQILRPKVFDRQGLQDIGTYIYSPAKILNPFTLQSTEGKPFDLAALKGKSTILFFGYTSCPDICPTTMALLTKVKAALIQEGRYQNTQIVLVSVDPDRDTIDKLKTYVGYFGEDFIGVTGELTELYNFARQLNIAFNVNPPKDQEFYEVDHSGNIVYLNEQGHYLGFSRPPLNIDRIVTSFRSIHELTASQ